MAVVLQSFQPSGMKRRILWTFLVTYKSFARRVVYDGRDREITRQVVFATILDEVIHTCFTEYPQLSRDNQHVDNRTIAVNY